MKTALVRTVICRTMVFVAFLLYVSLEVLSRGTQSVVDGTRRMMNDERQ